MSKCGQTGQEEKPSQTDRVAWAKADQPEILNLGEISRI